MESPADPRTGDLAFLFTDIVGSTVRWERDPEAMRQDVRAHDELLRAAIEGCGGTVFKTVGDAFCAVFACVEDALRAAADAQLAIGRAPFLVEDGLTVRMAVHAGPAEAREGDYFGQTLNRVARLLAIGHGGQVLLSNAAMEAIRDSRAVPGDVRDLGNHRLKDLTAPEHVFQLLVPGLTVQFPPLHSLTVLENNLPQQTTSFLGREEDLDHIRALMQDARLVTLGGAGGVGKTRCAVQIGAENIERYADGVWFCDLAPITDPAGVAAAVGRVLKIPDAPNVPMIEALVTYLRHKHVLLIFDNCEHVLPAVAALAAALLQNCAQLRILSTSREPLNIAGEALFRMPSLGMPAAVALFEERARAANRKFSVTPENAATVADICRRLDGIPLAIELAAARIRVLSPKQLAEKLNERFRILTGGDRAALPRQQTMRALIDWSYEMLAERERSIFRQLAVFSGGFTYLTAAAVCETPEIDAIEVLDVLTSLVDKSLVSAEPGEDDARYRLLESMREYARDRLAERGELDAAVLAHARAFADYAEKLGEEYDGIAPEMWLTRAAVDMDNVRAALASSFSPKGDVSVGQRLAATLPRLFGVLAAAEGQRWVRAALESVTEETPLRVRAALHLASASLASVFNQFRAAHAAAGLAMSEFEELDDAEGLCDAQRLAGRSLVYLGRVAEGEALLTQALSCRRSRGSPRTGGILGDLAVARALTGDFPASRDLFSRASAAFAEEHDTSKLAITAATLAEAEFLAGNAVEALALAERALTAVRELGRQRTAAAILGNISAYHIALGQHEPARMHAREALQLSRDAQADAVSVAFSLQHLSAVAALRSYEDAQQERENAMRAARVLGFVDGRLRSLEIAREHTEQTEYERVRAVLETRLGVAAFQEDYEHGMHWSEDRAVEISSAL